MKTRIKGLLRFDERRWVINPFNDIAATLKRLQASDQGVYRLAKSAIDREEPEAKAARETLFRLGNTQ